MSPILISAKGRSAVFNLNANSCLFDGRTRISMSPWLLALYTRSKTSRWLKLWKTDSSMETRLSSSNMNLGGSLNSFHSSSFAACHTSSLMSPLPIRSSSRKKSFRSASSVFTELTSTSSKGL